MVEKPRLYDSCGGHLALDLANSVGRSLDGLENERLSDYPALLQWTAEAGLLPEARRRKLRRAAAGREDEARAVLERAVGLREAIFKVATNVVHGRSSPRRDLERINVELARALGRARVAKDGQGYGWSWEWGDELDAPLWPLARAAAELLVSPECDAIRECANDSCLWLFIDHSRNHARRWCDMKTCGNLEKVRRHRRRLRGEAEL